MVFALVAVLITVTKYQTQGKRVSFGSWYESMVYHSKQSMAVRSVRWLVALSLRSGSREQQMLVLN